MQIVASVKTLYKMIGSRLENDLIKASTPHDPPGSRWFRPGLPCIKRTCELCCVEKLQRHYTTQLTSIDLTRCCLPTTVRFGTML